MERLFSRIFRSAVAWSFVATSLRFGAAILILPLILRRVPPEELGLWYVFLSFGALATIIDFGFAQTITRAVAYLCAGAQELSPYGLAHPQNQQNAEDNLSEDSKPNISLLSRLIGALQIYYAAIGAVALILLLAAGGWWVYLKTGTLPDAISLRIAFVVYSVGIALNLVGGIWLYSLNGVNRVRESLQLSTLCLIENYTIVVIGLLAGFRLWALVIGTFAMGLTERLLGRIVFYKFAPLEKAQFDSQMIKLLWPNAWRAGSVALGGYMVLQANTLICSGFLGLKATASYGLSLQAAALLAGISSVWVAVKFPLINQLRAQGRLKEITELFQKRVSISVGTYLLGACVLLFLGPWALTITHAKTQFLPTPLFATLLTIYFLEAHHCLYAGLIYSENVNPFVLPAVISGTAMVLLSLWLTPRIGVWGMLLSQGVVQLCFNNWWSVIRGVRGLEIEPTKYWSTLFNWIPFANCRSSSEQQGVK